MTGLTSLRGLHANDLSFISKTWRHALRVGTSYYQLIDRKLFDLIYGNVIDALLARPDVWVTVMCLSEEPEIIVGYAVCEMRDDETLIHWVYVKPAWRRHGIARSIVPDTASTATHITRLGRIILLKHPKIKFNPFSI